MTAAQLAIAREHGWWKQQDGRWECSCASCLALRAEASRAIVAEHECQLTVRAWRNLTSEAAEKERDDRPADAELHRTADR